MATAALIVSLASALFALGSVAVAVWQGRMNTKSIAREEADCREQMRLLEAQVSEELQARRHARSANFSITLDRLVRADRYSHRDFGYGIDADRFEFVISNLGPAAASNLAAWLALEGQDEPVSLVERRPNLMPGEDWALALGASDRGGTLELAISWGDGAGRHQEVLYRR